MKKAVIFSILPVLLVSTFFFYYKARVESVPLFYIATDKTFGVNEIPYVNLEGARDKEYDFRVYVIEKPDQFLIKSVKNRYVQENNETAVANPIAIFKKTFLSFKQDLLKIARSELNPKTRKFMRLALGIEYKDTSDEEIEAASFGLLKEHKFVKSFTIPKLDDKWSYNRVPVPIADKGVYLVEAVCGANVSYTVVVKTNLNFVTKQADNQTLIYAAARDTGEQVKGASVSMIDAVSGEKYYNGTTDADGTAEYTGKTREKNLIVIENGKDFAVSDPNFYAKSFYGEGGIRAFLYTERPVYRPKDTVYFKGIVRNFSSDKYTVASGNGKVDVVNPEGTKILLDIPVTVSGDTGTFTGDFSLPSQDELVLGVYNLILNYNDKSYSTEFSVEAYKKPTFLVTAAASKKIYPRGETASVKVEAKYYYGAPLAKTKAQCKVYRRAKYFYSPVGVLPYFADASEYLGISDVNLPREFVMEQEIDLDENGSGEIKIKPEKIDNDYTYTVIASVTEDNSTMSGSASFSINRCAYYIKVEKNSNVYSPGDKAEFKAELVPFDPAITPENKKKEIAEKKLKAVLYTRSFERISQESDRKEVDSTKLNTDENGMAKVSFDLKKAGHYIVEFSSSDSSGEETKVTTPVWASSKSDSIQTSFKNLTLTLSKDIYRTGETAELLMVTPASDGTLLITLEGNRVFSHETIKLKGNSFKYSIMIKPEMTPNFTISVTQFAANEIYTNNIKVVAPPLEKFIQVGVKPGKDIYKPGDTVELELDTKDVDNKAVEAEVSVGVVDEAVYQIQEDKNPKLSAFFYHPRRNNVSSVYSNEYRFFGYSEEKRLKLALDSKKNPPLAVLKDLDQSREQFKDTTYWTAKVKTGSSGKAKVSFKLAENITTWRITAVAVTADTKVGQAAGKFIARKDLMVKSILPSYFIKGEKQTIAASIANMSKVKMDGTVNLTAPDTEIIGEKSRSFSVEPGKTAKFYFQVKTKEDSSKDSCSFEFKATAGQFTDGEIKKVPLKRYGIFRTKNSYALLSGTQGIGVDINDKQKELKLKTLVTPGEGAAVRESLSYLVDYPYGCIEQIMSRFVPVLAAKQAGYISPVLSEKLPSMVSAGLANLKGQQKESGGFGWYGEKEADPMMTAYAYRSLVLCKDLYGQSDDEMTSRARSYLYEFIGEKNPEPFQRAFVLYCLSEEKKVENSMVDKLVSEKTKMSPYAKALTSGVLANCERNEEAMSFFSEALKESGANVAGKTFSDQKASWEYDEIETAATILSVSIKTGFVKEAQEQISENLISSRNGIAWKNSRDTGIAVLALSEYLESQKKKEEPAEIAVSINGNPAVTITANPDAVFKGEALYTLPAGMLKIGSNVIQYEKKKGGKVFVTAITEFFDASTSFKEESGGVEISRKYYSVKADKNNKIDVSQATTFEQGSLVMVELLVKRKNGSDSYILVDDALPAGFSVERNDEQYYSSNYPKEFSRKMAYDDRTVFFLSGNFDTYTVRYFLRADIPGDFRVLPAKASLMYYPGFSGNSSDSKLIVKE